MSGRFASILSALLAFGAPPALAQGFAGLGGDASGFEQVVPRKPLVFPRDFGAHEKFRTEWWYVTADLTDESGASYGVQWTLFRQAGAPGDQRPGWANQTVWMGHAAATTASEHLFAQTFARGGVGQAGVTAHPFRAWIDDWSFASRDDAPGAGISRAKISAGGEGFRYAFDLAADGPLVSQGDKGFSLKSDDGRAPTISASPSTRFPACSRCMARTSNCRALPGWTGNGARNCRPAKKAGTGFRCILPMARN